MELGSGGLLGQSNTISDFQKLESFPFDIFEMPVLLCSMEVKMCVAIQNQKED